MLNINQSEAVKAIQRKAKFAEVVEVDGVLRVVSDLYAAAHPTPEAGA